MYNEEVKNRYLNQKQQETEHISAIIGRLNHIEKYEKELEKDACNFSFHDIDNYYRLSNFKSFNVISNVNSALKGYTQWCIENGLVYDNINHYKEFNPSILSNYINTILTNVRIISREELLNGIRTLLNPRDQFLLLAIFEYGKSKYMYDTTGVRPEDLQGNLLHLPTGRIVEVSNELVHIINEAAATDLYTYNFSEKKMIDDGTIMKVLRKSSPHNNASAQKRVYNNFVKIMDMIGYKDMITITSLVESGMIHMIQKIMKEQNLSMEEVLYNKNYKEDIEKQYDCKINASEFLLKYGDVI